MENEFLLTLLTLVCNVTIYGILLMSKLGERVP